MIFMWYVYRGNFLILLALVATGVPTASNGKPAVEPVEIRVNASYSASSLWSESEIRKRFEITKDAYAKACPGVNLVLNELVRVEENDLQDVDGSLTHESVNVIKKLLTHFKSNVRPTIFYVTEGQVGLYGAK